MDYGIPTLFYAIDALMYFVSAIIGFMLSFYFHRIYSISSEKRHMYVHLGFLLLSIGLMAVSISSMFSFAARMSPGQGLLALEVSEDVHTTEDFSYLVYFGFSIFAYFLFILVYANEYLKFSKIFVLAFIGYLVLLLAVLPVKESHGFRDTYEDYFHPMSFIMLIFISFRNFVNYSETKNVNSLLVAFSFSMLSLFHLFHMFSFFSGWMYVLGHASIMLGFAGFFILIMKVMKLSIRIKFFNRLLAKIIRFEKSLLEKGGASKEKDKLRNQGFSFRV